MSTTFPEGSVFWTEHKSAGLDTPAEKILWVLYPVQTRRFRRERPNATKVSRGWAERYAKAQGFKIINY